jgi:hypothetical protein
MPHTGEVFFNVTNLQWLTAFVLIQQVLIAPSKARGERIADFSILAIVTLTGPFGVAFFPLFVWRWWRERTRENLLIVVIVGAAAALQAWYVFRVGPKFEFQAVPLQFWPNLVVLARRLVAWPLIGYGPALALSASVVGIVGGAILAAMLGWALRPHPRRVLRAQVVAAFALIVAAAIYRARPDTWGSDNLDFGERYFYIPRVLLAWLVIWEFDAGPRWIRNTARLFGLAVLLVHIWNYTMPAPKNYHWADHVEPIRRGVPARIPTLPEDWTLEYRGKPQRR